MSVSPLEQTVRDHLFQKLQPMSGRRPHEDAEAVADMIERRLASVLEVLRERMSDEAIPTPDDVFGAEMEVTNRTIEKSIGRMRHPSTQDPRRREILAALADDAEQNLAVFRTIGPDVTEEQLAEITESVIRRQQALNRRFFPKAELDPPATQ